MLSEKSKRRIDKDESNDIQIRCGRIRSSEETAVMGVERRDSIIYTLEVNNQKWEDKWKKESRLRLHNFKC